MGQHEFNGCRWRCIVNWLLGHHWYGMWQVSELVTGVENEKRWHCHLSNLPIVEKDFLFNFSRNTLTEASHTWIKSSNLPTRRNYEYLWHDPTPLLASISRVNLNQDSVTFSHYYLLVLHNIVVLRDERHFDWVQWHCFFSVVSTRYLLRSLSWM